MAKDNPTRVLVVAPHPDDEMLGAGGTMARFSMSGAEITVLTMAAHMPPIYPPEVHERTVKEARKAHAMVGVKESIFQDNPAVLLGQIPVPEFNGGLQKIVDRVRPEVMLMPYYDRHIDHRQVFDAAMVASRPVGAGAAIKLLAAYETLSETHWNAPHIEPNFTPTWYVDITDCIETKITATSCYESQIQPYPGPRSLEALRALALFRGSQVGMGYAEAFHVIRMSTPPGQLF